jgi:endo-1,4-beta-xylanase
LAEAKGRSIGTAVNNGPLFYDKKYSAVLADEFDIVTPENSLKFDATQHGRSLFIFEDGDFIVDFARSHHMKVRGHTLVWYAALPSWLTEKKYSKEELKEILHEHIRAVAGHFRDKVYCWDVVNEAFEPDGSFRHNIWYDALGPDYIEMAFRWTHEVDPDALLFYNDYNYETLNAKSDAIYKIIKDLKDKGVPINGIGFQAHLNLTTDLKKMDANIKRFAKLGLETDFTELDVSISQGPRMGKKERSIKQAEVFSNVFSDCLNNPSCKMVVLWGFTDAYTWKKTVDRDDKPTIFDEQYRPKPAYYGIMKALSGYK